MDRPESEAPIYYSEQHQAVKEVTLYFEVNYLVLILEMPDDSIIIESFKYCIAIVKLEIMLQERS